MPPEGASIVNIPSQCARSGSRLTPTAALRLCRPCGDRAPQTAAGLMPPAFGAADRCLRRAQIPAAVTDTAGDGLAKVMASLAKSRPSGRKILGSQRGVSVPGAALVEFGRNAGRFRLSISKWLLARGTRQSWRGRSRGAASPGVAVGSQSEMRRSAHKPDWEAALVLVRAALPGSRAVVETALPRAGEAR